MNLIKKMRCLGVAFAALLAFAIPAHAQLALSYKLDVRASRTEQPEIFVNPCAGLNWMTSIGACGRELLSRVAPTPRGDGNLAVFEPAAIPSLAELPELGRSERWQRMGVSNSGNGKTADLLFRFGSKFRQRNEDSASEWYRFSDTTYDNYVKQNSHKAVGVELFVPFQ